MDVQSRAGSPVFPGASTTIVGDPSVVLPRGFTRDDFVLL